MGSKGEPSAINSKLGFLLTGRVSTQIERKDNVSNCNLLLDERELFQKFCELESIPNDHLLSNEDQICEETYKSTVIRSSSGRYSVNLPFKSNPSFGDTRSQALKRFECLEKKLNKNESFKNQYVSFMKEYLELNHMEKIPSDSLTFENCFYLPHHGVFEENSISTKLRVVFDASAKSSLGNSLNDELLIGPKLQTDLFSHLIKFRTHKIAFSADIEKMFRQINMSEEHSDYQRILWRFSPDEPIEDYRLKTFTYGTASASFLAIRTLKQLAHDEKLNYPLASEITLNDFYVDDLLTGANSKNEASAIISEINNLMQSGGFTLRKWSSNYPEILNDLPDNVKSNSHSVMIHDDSLKILGIIWTTKTDSFKINVNLNLEVISKRQLLSAIAHIFDPLGFLSPSTILLKILLQQLWKDKLSWDDPIPVNVLNVWNKFREECYILNDITIPRYISCYSSSHLIIEMHGFCDASGKAYSAVIYTNWLKNPSAKLDSFVKNRIAKIQNLTDDVTWKHVCSEDNPADCASRGILPRELQNHELWWSGPSWLSEESSSPENKEQPVTHEPCDPENSITAHAEVQQIPDFMLHYSSYTKLIRVTAWIQRFIFNLKHPNSKHLGFLSADELHHATLTVIRTVQGSVFHNEISSLKCNKVIPRSSKLNSLNAFLDQGGILRVGGRLSKSQTLSYDQKHPMLLPKSHVITKLIVRHYHLAYLHAGPQLLLAILRQKFWIPDGRSVVREETRKS
ncbi:uncharacterized protein LOC129228558 [Uloborus diversus]|uniref:uncharacterized protein LOC129228558 n=1 Tax=Uloborus diversus TaxID=327109 RepID=UPI002409184D|nr:uncharacterized protein LOC129228558 [Uloborus diversus]